MIKTKISPETLFRVVMWVISTVFAGFLIGLGGKIVADLPVVQKSLRIEDFDASHQITALEGQADQTQRDLGELERRRERDQLASDGARAAYASEHQNFRNWLATRGITEDSKENPEVVSRTNRLEELGQKERMADQECEHVAAEILARNQALQATRSRLAELQGHAQVAYSRAAHFQALIVFLVRLAFTLPLLIAGVVAFRRTRQSKYWPLWRGFIGFALYCFFFELVPYLPSYGGYVRYSVGVILTLVAGHYAIKGMQAYLVRRRETEKQEEAARRGAMDKDSALRMIANNLCPSCERAIITQNGQPATFCVHCGLNLFSECGHCRSRMNSFYTHCGSCGKVLDHGAKHAASGTPPILNPDPAG